MLKLWIRSGAALGALAMAVVSVQAGSAAVSASVPVRAEQSGPQALVDGYVAANKLPGVVLAYASGDVAPTFVSAGRIADGPDAPLAGPDSLWRVYSMTKPITAMAAMILIEEGKIGLDQPISDFIPAFKDMTVLVDPAATEGLASRPATRPITVRNLLTHTAGLGYNIITKGPLLDAYNRMGINPATVNVAMEQQFAKVRPTSLEAFANKVAELPLIAEPGTKWSYSIGLDVLGRVIEVASGMAFDTFVQTRLLDPLKMTSTYWTVPASEAGRLATNYTFVGENRVPIDPGATSVWLSPPAFPYGGAGLVMSARDYDRFLHMLLNLGTLDGARVMKPETARLAMSNLLPDGVDYGGVAGATGGMSGTKLGFGAGGSVYLESVPGGPGKGTYGWGGAAGTFASVDPTNHVRIVGMVNYFPSDKWPLRAEAVTAIYAATAK
ncbi:MAG: serine hydrolase domain-containing protein [Pseudomonadota bacterium]